MRRGEIGVGGKSGKGPIRVVVPTSGNLGLIMWEGGEDAEVREGGIGWGEGGLASEGADKQEDKNEEEVSQARVPHLGVGAVVGNT